MRTPNQWRFFSSSKLNTLLNQFGSKEELAQQLDVATDSIRKWQSGRSIPSNRFQVAMAALLEPLRKDTSSVKSSQMVKQYIEATRMTNEAFADLADVSESTVEKWVEGVSKPRKLNYINQLLQTPRP